MADTFNKLLEIIEDLIILSGKKQKLLEKLKTLVKRDQNILEINEKNYQVLSGYRLIFQDHMAWKSRKNYLEIIENFLNNQIDGDKFCIQIKILRSQNMNKAEEVEANFKFQKDFSLTSQSIGFSEITEQLNSLIDLFDSSLDNSESNDFNISENTLKSAIKESIIPRFSKYQ